MKNEESNAEFRERLLNFAVSSITFLKTVPHKKEYDVLRTQLSRSATAIGANYEESQSSSYKEFLQRVKIALREANDTVYWLKIIRKLKICDDKSTTALLNEANEISKILGAIASKAAKNLDKK